MVSDATATFLAAAADDLQRQLRISGDVIGIRALGLPDGVTLIATVRVGRTAVELAGSGGNLVAAYGDLLGRTAEPVLAAAFRELVSA